MNKIDRLNKIDLPEFIRSEKFITFAGNSFAIIAATLWLLAPYVLIVLILTPSNGLFKPDNKEWLIFNIVMSTIVCVIYALLFSFTGV